MCNEYTENLTELLGLAINVCVMHQIQQNQAAMLNYVSNECI